MYRKLAVPLDGSPLAEKALPNALKLACLLNAQLLLIQVVEQPESMFEDFELEAQVVEETKRYLENIKAHITDPATEFYLAPEQVKALIVSDGSTTQELGTIAVSEGVDLLVMTTHGRSGMARLVMGSVAFKVLQDAKLPVVLIRPGDGDHFQLFSEAEPLSPDRKLRPVLVTLDGTIEGEIVLEPAIELAKQLKTGIFLLLVVKPIVPVPASEIGPVYVFDQSDLDQALEEEREQAKAYLEKIESTIKEKGISCDKEVRIGYPAIQIMESIHQQEALLVAMATHGRSSIGQVFLGSVADEIVRQSHLPVLLVHRAHPARKP